MAGRKLRFDAPETDAVSGRPSESLTAVATVENDGAQTVGVEPESLSVVPEPHAIERAIQLELLNQSDVRFSSLVVRRFRDGVCLQGVIEVEIGLPDDDLPDIERIARELSGVNRVMNHLVVRRHSRNA